MQLDYRVLGNMLSGAVEIIREKNDELSRLDAVIGDGDHGVTMLRAMEKIGEILASQPEGSISTTLGDIAWALMGIDGGATGPLYGSLFLGMSDATAGKEALTAQDFAQMMESGLTSLQQQTKAQIGDKTLLDALIPAVQALRQAADQGDDIPVMLQKAAGAAMQGAESTRQYPAKFGRAKFQGERTIGHMDPGSVSLAYIFQGFYNSLVYG